MSGTWVLFVMGSCLDFGNHAPFGSSGCFYRRVYDRSIPAPVSFFTRVWRGVAAGAGLISSRCSAKHLPAEDILKLVVFSPSICPFAPRTGQFLSTYAIRLYYILSFLCAWVDRFILYSLSMYSSDLILSSVRLASELSLQGRHG